MATTKSTKKTATKKVAAPSPAMPKMKPMKVNVNIEQADNGYMVSAWINDNRRILIAKDEAEAMAHMKTLLGVKK